MIKSVILSNNQLIEGRVSDGMILCENNQGYGDQTLEGLKIKIRRYHKQITSHLQNQSNTPLKQIENQRYGIFYKISSHVIFTLIVEITYPLKLVNAFLDIIISSFFDEAKCVFGGNNLHSRIEAIENSHYFIKFDRVIKQKKKQYEDPNSIKNTQRLKKQLESIHDLIKQNMNMLESRQKDLERTEQKALKINEESKKFEKNSKNLVWHLWFRKNLLWFVLVLLVVVIYFCL